MKSASNSTTPNAGSATGLTKDVWIERATTKLLPYMPDGAREYADTLYHDFVEGFGDEWADDPEGAVDEDLSNWSD